MKYDEPESNIESEEDIIAAIAPAMTSAANQTGVYSASTAGRTFPPSGIVTSRPRAHAPSRNEGTKRSTHRIGQSANDRLRTVFEPAAKKRWFTCGNIATPKPIVIAVESIHWTV